MNWRRLQQDSLPWRSIGDEITKLGFRATMSLPCPAAVL